MFATFTLNYKQLGTKKFQATTKKQTELNLQAYNVNNMRI